MHLLLVLLTSCRWVQYYLAHNTIGPTKGIWWEHVVPAAAFRMLHANLSHQQQGAGLGAQNSSWNLCPNQLLELYRQAAAAGLPVAGRQPWLCKCSWSRQLRHQLGLQVSTTSYRSSTPVATAYGAPVAAANVTPVFVQLSSELRVITASLHALSWLKSTEGRTTFPSIAPGGNMV